MEGALIVIPLLALVLPIVMLLAALVFDAAIAVWAIYRTLHDRPPPRLWLFATHPGTWFHWSHGSTQAPLTHG